MPMRRLCLILLCGLVAVPAALAAARATGDGVLELQQGQRHGASSRAPRGTLWGQIDKGKLVVTDPIVGDGQVLVSGAEHEDGPPCSTATRSSTAAPTSASASPAAGTG